ncbi:hypothetical protein HNQ56_002349 [Anaerotaenia torta]|uniref:YcdB/YcdC domain-containing protein n=1 Tax=Anaerotaenia torta TaxID=433293 RepID=UPI003D206C51
MKKMIALMVSGVVLVSSLPMPRALAMAETAGKAGIAAEIAEEDAVADIIAAAGEDKAPVVTVSEEKRNLIAASTPGGSSEQPTQAALEAAIKMVKSKIMIPAEYSEFDYYFNDFGSYSGAYWNMNWRTKDGNARISVSCDKDFHIIDYYKSDYSNRETGVSKYLRKELKKTAEDFITKTVPDTFGKLNYISVDFDGVYNGNYGYHFQRVEKGIPFPENYVNVSVNSITGEVTALTVNWLYDAKIPSSATKLSLEDASKKIKESMQMKLEYRSGYGYIPIYEDIARTAKKAFLVYEPTLPYISVDAVTGEVYLNKAEWRDTGAKDNFAAMETESAKMAMGGDMSLQLTTEELARIEELGKVITKEKAIEAVTSNSALYLDKNLVLQSATLNKQTDSSGKASYVWNISLNDPREINYEKDASYYRAYAYATVDGVTGKILSFHASVKSYYDEVKHQWTEVKVPHDIEKARAVLEKFMKAQAKDRFSKSVLSEASNDYVVYYKNNQSVYGGYSYLYNRTNEGVEYPNNRLYGSVDGVTGKIYSFGSYWDDSVSFESTKGAMDAAKAMDAYLAKEGYGLKYEINQIGEYDSKSSSPASIKYEVRLVYRPDVNPSAISPFTGEQLDYDGKAYQAAKSYTYEDVTDEKLYRNILLLADMNIGFDGGKFLPEQAITAGELNELMDKIGYGYYTDTAQAGQKDTRLITREEAAQIFISKLGLDKLAQLKGIYKTDFTDEASIDTKYLGAVALAKGLGLVKADNEQRFNPKSSISRYDAVELIMNYISVQRSGVY